MKSGDIGFALFLFFLVAIASACFSIVVWLWV